MPKNSDEVKVIFIYEAEAEAEAEADAMYDHMSRFSLAIGQQILGPTPICNFVLGEKIKFQCFIPSYASWDRTARVNPFVGFYSNAEIVVFMVDSNKPSTFEFAKKKLKELKEAEQLSKSQYVFVDVATPLLEQPSFDTNPELVSRPLQTFMEIEGIHYDYISGLNYALRPYDFRQSFGLALENVYNKSPVKRSVSASSPILSLVSSNDQGGTGFPNSVLSQPGPSPRPRSRPSSLFGPAAANPYLLKRAASPKELDFSNHFRDIYIVLRAQVRTFHMSMVAKACQTCQNTGSVLNQENLQGRAREDSSSRTAQTLRVMDKLSNLANYEEQFLDEFQQRYSDDYNNTFMARSAKAVEWAAGEEVNEVTNHERIIQLLCHAENNPRSRTARIVKDMFEHLDEWQSPTSSHTPSRRQ